MKPSIDRIDCDLGYTPENCRVVCFMANVGMADWGEEVLWRVLEGLVRTADRAV